MENKITKDRIYIHHIKEVHGATYGVLIYCVDGTLWRTLCFKIGKLSIKGKFIKLED